jgi:hypothetical protein
MVGAAAVLGLVAHPLTRSAALAGGLAGAALGALIAYRKAPRIGGRRALRIVACALIACGVGMVAAWVALRVGHAQRTASWPGWETDTVAAAAAGMTCVLALLPRHLHVAFDPVQAAVRWLPDALDAEVRGLCDRSTAIWAGTKQQLAHGDPGLALVRDGVLKALEVAGKSVEVAPSLAGEAELARRIEDLDARIAAATDAEVKAQYEQARGALEDQRRYRAHIRGSRDRLIARLHHHVAALEKFQLAASGLAAARAATAGQAAVAQLAELSQDVAASGDALAELELEPTAPAAAAAG